ncbi:MAG: cytochrome c [Proteobacteria bacterium]|nr:cytochrome c [Pseudomonadota bacterium]
MRFLGAIGALAIIFAILTGVYFLGGFYNVAAAVDEAAPVKWALMETRRASIARHEDHAKPPFALDDQTVIQQGARNFATAGCVNCHGAPGAKWAKFSEGLNPDPPDLKDVAKGASAGRIFWVIKNGIRMTGMPSFEKAGLTDDEIWHIAAFVKAIPKVSEADYRTWTAAPNP